MPLLRLFSAIETPADITPRIAAIRDTLRSCHADVRWEQEDKFHATLRFLGDIPDHLLPEIVSSIERVSEHFGPLTVRYHGIGCFPDRKRPRVVWVGVDETSGELRALQAAIEDALHTIGYEREERRFHAHVTIGRVRSHKNIHNLLETMESVTFESPPVIITALSLVRSDLKPGGSIYTTLKQFPLRRNP